MKRYSLQFREKPVQSVFQRGQSKFVQLSFEAGQGLTKHRAPLPLTVIVLTGRIRFSTEETTEVLDASDMLALDPGVEHAVEAIERSTVLLVLTPDGEASVTPVAQTKTVDYENAFDNPEIVEQICSELRPLVEDHVTVCKVLKSVMHSTDLGAIRKALMSLDEELNTHFRVEERVLFPLIADHLGGIDVGPVPRLLEEHEHIRQLHMEATDLLMACEQSQDDHSLSLLTNKVSELSTALLNHLGKEDSHLFPIASRILTADEKSAVAAGLQK